MQIIDEGKATLPAPAPPTAFFARVYPDVLRAAELACLKRRRQQARTAVYSPTDPAVPGPSAPAGPAGLPGDTVGLALSGGGIRSATFSLGVLQALAANGLLRHVDYLSTVSGGGYIGAFLGGLIQRREPIAAGGLDRDRPRRTRPRATPERCRCAGCAITGATCLPTAPGTKSSPARSTCATWWPFTSCWPPPRSPRWGPRRCCTPGSTSAYPGLLPHWMAGGVRWSPFLLLPMATLLIASVRSGGATGSSCGDKDPPASDMIAAGTAVSSRWPRRRRALHARRRAAQRWSGWRGVLAALSGAGPGRAGAPACAPDASRSSPRSRCRSARSCHSGSATSLVITAACAAFALVDSLGMAVYLWLARATAPTGRSRAAGDGRRRRVAHRAGRPAGAAARRIAGRAASVAARRTCWPAPARPSSSAGFSFRSRPSSTSWRGRAARLTTRARWTWWRSPG